MVKEALASTTGRRPHASDSDTLQGEGGRCEVSRKATPPDDSCACAQCPGATSSIPWKPALKRAPHHRSHPPDHCRPGEAAALQ